MRCGRAISGPRALFLSRQWEQQAQTCLPFPPGVSVIEAATTTQRNCHCSSKKRTKKSVSDWLFGSCFLTCVIFCQKNDITKLLYNSTPICIYNGVSFSKNNKLQWYILYKKCQFLRVCFLWWLLIVWLLTLYKYDPDV